MRKKSVHITAVHGNPAFALRSVSGGGDREKDGGTLVIGFKPGAIAPIAAAPRGLRAVRKLDELPNSVREPLSWLKSNFGLSEVTPLFGTGAARGLRDARPAARFALALRTSVEDAPLKELSGFTVARVDPDKLTDRLLRKLSDSSSIEFAERVPTRWLMASRARKKKTDPEANNQWALRAIGAFDQKLPDASTVEVAILDSGIDTTHPDLRNVAAAYDHGKYSADDLIGHGTHVAGIVAAIANNGIGIAGIANCRLRVWKVFSDTPDAYGELYTNDDSYLRALGHAAASPARVINLSLGGLESSRAERELINLLISRGKIVVAAMGNEYEEGNPTEYPAAYRNVISVGAIAANLQWASFSNTGRHISLVAPGKNVLSTLPMKRSPFRALDEIKYAHWDGTSMATPYVAGCIALAIAKRADLDATTMIAGIPKMVRKIGAMKRRRFTPKYGYGLVHLPTLLRAVATL